MSKNKFRHESMKPEQFDNDDFTMKIFEYSKSIFQLMIVVNGSVVAALFAKDFSLYRETIGIVFSGIIFSFIFKSLGIASLFGYARGLFVFYPCKTHSNPKFIAEGNTDIKIENIHPG